MPKIIVFDVNETLLNLNALNPHFELAFGSAAVRKEWFSEVLKQAFVSTITGDYTDFTEIARSALLMTEMKHAQSLTEQQRSEILHGMESLPAHPEVKEALERLRSAGWRMIALTNSTLKVAQMQLANSGVRPYLEHTFSADAVSRLKPAREPYEMAAREANVGTGDLLMVAAHAWDIAGAAKAGLRTAFLARPGQHLDSLTPKPDYQAPDLLDLARQLA